MKPAGAVLCAVGLLAAFYFVFVFDTSVPTEAGGRVNNIGLIADRQNGLIFSLGLAIIGTMLLVGGSSRSAAVKTPEESRRSRNLAILSALTAVVGVIALALVNRLLSPRIEDQVFVSDPSVVVTMRLKPSAIEITNDTDGPLEDCTVTVSNRRAKVTRLQARSMSPVSFTTFDQGGLTESLVQGIPTPTVECRDSSNRRKLARVYWFTIATSPKTQ